MEQDIEKVRKFEFFIEIDNIKNTNLSSAMKCVCEFFLRFQWVEYRSKKLVLLLYDKINTQILSISKQRKIKKMSIAKILEELESFSIGDSRIQGKLTYFVKTTKELKEKRNKLAHNLFDSQLSPKSILADFKPLLKEVDNLGYLGEKLSSSLRNFKTSIEKS